MIKFLRHPKVQRRIIIGAACLIVPGFIFFGISVDNLGGNALAGRIGNKKIKVDEFVRNYQALSRELELFHGLGRAQTAGADYEELTWQRILLVHAARQRNIKVSDEELASWLRHQNAFIDRDGNFDVKLYKALINGRYGINPKRFENDLREFLMLQKVRDAFREDVAVSESEIRDLFQKTYAPRDFDYLIVTKESLDTPSVITDEELHQYYEWMQGGLLHPESVRIKIAAFEGAPDQAPADPAAYLESDGRVTPFLSREDALPGIGFSEPLTQAAFALTAPGERSGWISDGEKSYVIELIEKQEQKPMSFEDAKNILTERLTSLKVRKDLAALADKLITEAKDTSLTEASQKHNLALRQAKGWFEGTYIDGAGEVGALKEAIKNLSPNEIGNPVPFSKGFLIVQIKSIGIVDQKLWDEKKEELKLELRFEKELDVYESSMRDLQLSLQINKETMQRLFPSKYKAIEATTPNLPKPTGLS